jgi:hypothetical protein
VGLREFLSSRACKKILLFRNSDLPYRSPHPAPLGGAYRERHVRWMRDAVDARCRETGGMCADGEVVWSWRPVAGAKLAMMHSHCADDGDNKVWFTEESAYKP